MQQIRFTFVDIAKCNFVSYFAKYFHYRQVIVSLLCTSFLQQKRKYISRDFLAKKKNEDRREGKLCHFCGHITPQLNFQLSSRFQELALCCCVRVSYPGVKLKIQAGNINSRQYVNSGWPVLVQQYLELGTLEQCNI